MKGTRDKYRALCFAGMALLLGSVSCGSAGNSTSARLTDSAATSAAQLQSDTAAIPDSEIPPPPAADQPDPAELQRILSSELERLGKDPERTTVQAPSGADNAVFDLVVSYRSTRSGATLHWTERMIGDYDMNGEVNAADLTPISQRWKFTVKHLEPEDARGFLCWPEGHPRNGGFSGILNGFPGFNTPAHQWRTARVDGDDNGEINAADIASIAQQWHERLDSYRIYRRAPGEDDFSMLRLGEEDTYSIPRGNNFPRGATAPDPAWVYRLHYADVTVQPGTYEYYLAPFDSQSGDEGTPSPVISITFDDSNPPPQPEGNLPPEIIVVADVTSGDAPLRVEFDASQSSDPDGEIVLYSWDWEGDGQVDASSQSSPYAYHIYNDTGWYQPEITVWDDLGGSATARIEIEVGVGSGGVLPPKLELSASPAVGPAPLAVELTAQVTAVDGNYAGMHYEIDHEGDGVVDYTYGKHPLPPVPFVFEASGVYHPTVTAINFAGLRTTASVEVTVNDNIGPQAVISLTPQTGVAPLDVHVSALDSVDPDGSELVYDWTLDGQPFFGNPNMQPAEFDHQFDFVGEYLFGLTVTDAGGLSDHAEAIVTVLPPDGDLPPVAVIHAEPLIGAAPLRVHFNADGSHDPEGKPITSRWDLNGSGNYYYNGQTDFEHVYYSPGVYQASLQVKDVYGQAAYDSVQITVLDNHPPLPVLVATPSSGDAPLMVGLDARDSTDPDGDEISFSWQFDYYPGDQHWKPGEALEGYNYRFGGKRTVRVRVTDQWGASAIAEAEVDVGGPGWYVVKLDDGSADFWSPDIGFEIVDGNPAVAYGAGKDMRYVRGNDPDGLSWATPLSIEYEDEIYSGVLGPSLSFINGAPCVGWMRHSGVVMYCRAMDSTGATWQDPTLVYYIGGSGSGTDIMTVAGNPAMLWVDSLGHMRYSRALDDLGALWDTPFDFGQISLGEGNCQAEMAIVNGTPSVAYVGGSWFESGVNYRWSNDANGVIWADRVQIYDATNSRSAVSLTTIAGNPMVAYYCELGLVFQIAPDGLGNTWREPVVITPEVGDGIGFFGCDEICIVELNGVPAVLDHSMGMWIADNPTGTSWYGPEHIPNYASGTTFALLEVNGQPAMAWQNGAVYYGVKLP
ncbi:MAG: PKD domain-containing protein [bacterium]